MSLAAGGAPDEGWAHLKSGWYSGLVQEVLSSSRSQVPALLAPPHAILVALQTDLGGLKDGHPLSSLTLASPSLGSIPGRLRSLGRLGLRGGPESSPFPWEAPGTARPPARPRPRLAAETGAAGTRAAGQSSLRPSLPRSPRSARGLPRGPDGCRPGLRWPLGTDLSRNPIARSAHRDCPVGDTAAAACCGGGVCTRRAAHPGDTEYPKLHVSL